MTPDERTSKRVIAVDFDATIAFYKGWKGSENLGEPIPEMVEKVKAALAHGDEVYIFTARVNPGSTYEHALKATQSYISISQWCQKYLGRLLPITYVKSWEFTEFWDDRAKQVLPNQGVFLEDLVAALKR